MASELWIYVLAVLVFAAVCAGVWAVQAVQGNYRGETVGSAAGLRQGGVSVPGAPIRVVVKRHADGTGTAPIVIVHLGDGFRELSFLEAKRLAEATEKAVAWMRDKT